MDGWMEVLLRCKGSINTIYMWTLFFYAIPPPYPAVERIGPVDNSKICFCVISRVL